jgi:hypothetical protein
MNTELRVLLVWVDMEYLFRFEVISCIYIILGAVLRVLCHLKKLLGFGPRTQSDRRFLAKLLPTFADIRCRVDSATDSHNR